MARNDEAGLQASLVDYVRRVCGEGVVIWHPPNGEYRDKRTAAKLKWMGVTPGIPDLVLWYGDGQTALWEVKAAKGKLSKDQAIMASWLTLSGFEWFLIRSIDDARQALADLGIETREAQQ